MANLLFFIHKILSAIRALYTEPKSLYLIPEDDVFPNWYLIAQKEIGVKEKVGGENPRIIEYHFVTSLKAKEDEVPWCSSFVSWCLEQDGIVSARSARARDYLKWGVVLNNPIPGCIVVFSRNGGGHVAFYVSETLGSILCLGGNQKNSVCFSEYPKAQVIGYRWPKF